MCYISLELCPTTWEKISLQNAEDCIPQEMKLKRRILKGKVP